ncbi:MAG: gamma-glutamyltransferase [Myxococcota bacterium]
MYWGRLLWATAVVVGATACSGASPSAPRPPAEGMPTRAAAEAVVSAGSPVAAEPPDDAAPPSFVVASDCEASVHAAATVLEAGGNAADATIVAVLVAGLAHPSASGLGGGGVALYFDAGRANVTAYDFRIVAPTPLVDANPWTLEARAPGRLKERDEAASARAMVGRPGELAGLTALQRDASRSWPEQIASALDALDEGFTVSPYLASAFRDHPDMAAALGLDVPVAVGTPLPRPRARQTLRRLADLDAVLPASVRPRAVARLDLLEVTRGEETMVTPATAGGFVLWESVSLLGDALPADPGARRHRQAEAFGLAVEDRMRHAGAGGTLPQSAEHLAARRARIDPKRRRQWPRVDRREGGTTNVVVIDAEGNAVAWSSSLGHTFGAEAITEEGIVLNDGLRLFARPAERRTFGDANAPRPGAPPAVSLAPTLILREGRVVAGLGAAGGEHIPTALAQVVLRRSPSNVDAPLALPRLRTPAGGGLWLEPSEGDLAPGLRALGHHVRTDVPDLTGVVMVTVVDGAPPRFRGYVDPRRGGAVATSTPVP